MFGLGNFNNTILRLELKSQRSYSGFGHNFNNTILRLEPIKNDSGLPFTNSFQ